MKCPDGCVQVIEGVTSEREMIGVEYSWDSKERYDGISEWQCPGCGVRIGRWTGQRLGPGVVEPRYGAGWPE